MQGVTGGVTLVPMHLGVGVLDVVPVVLIYGRGLD